MTVEKTQGAGKGPRGCSTKETHYSKLSTFRESAAAHITAESGESGAGDTLH